MRHRKFIDLPRLSGRPEAPPQAPQPQRVFRRFFDLLDRLERPAGAPPPSPRTGAGQGGRRRP